MVNRFSRMLSTAASRLIGCFFHRLSLFGEFYNGPSNILHRLLLSLANSSAERPASRIVPCSLPILLGPVLPWYSISLVPYPSSHPSLTLTSWHDMPCSSEAG